MVGWDVMVIVWLVRIGQIIDVFGKQATGFADVSGKIIKSNREIKNDSKVFGLNEMNGSQDFSLEHISFNFGMSVRYPH